jgi:hypothetical protein
MELAHLIGADRLARWIHRATLPSDLQDAGRLALEIEAGEYLGQGDAWLSQKEIDASMELYWARLARRAQDRGAE